MPSPYPPSWNDPDEVTHARYLDFDNIALRNQFRQGLRDSLSTDDDVNSEIRRRLRIWEIGYRIGGHLSVAEFNGRDFADHKMPLSGEVIYLLRTPLDSLILHRGVASGFNDYGGSACPYSLRQDRLAPAVYPGFDECQISINWPMSESDGKPSAPGA